MLRSIKPEEFMAIKDEHKILQAWISIREGDGLFKASRNSKILLFSGFILTILIAFLIYYQLNPIFLVALSIMLGWSIAERNALRTRIEMWPKLEKYLNWDAIQKNCNDKNAEQGN